MSFNSSPGPGYRSGKNSAGAGDVLFWLLIILTPLISALLIRFLTGTSALKLDAWNTTWNDEVGYNRVIGLLRNEFYPQGMYGFNEDAPAHLAYGPYNIFTYLPYFALSFVTGIASHNFIYYINVILAALACLLYVALVRPRAFEGFLTAFFMSAYLIAGRYIWSGMSESSYNFFLILFTALALWAVKHPEASPAAQGRAVFAMIFAVFFWNTMRPFYFPMLLVPVCLIFRQKSRLSRGAKILLFLFAALAAGASLGLFFFFTNYNVARYFFDSTQTETLKALLKSGSPVTMIRQILSANREALREIRGYLVNRRWAGGVTVLYFAQSLLLLVLFIRSLMRRSYKGDGRSAVLFGMLLAGAAVFEANVVLYTPVQLHRMMLAVTIAYGLLLIELGSWEAAACEVVLVALMMFLFAGAPQNFALPQISGQTLSAQEEEALRQEFKRILPLEEDPWDNTIAKVPESADLQWEFMLPTYTSLNVCQTDVMEELLRKGTLRSKFVIFEETSSLSALCAEKKYSVVWEGYGRKMYQIRK